MSEHSHQNQGVCVKVKIYKNDVKRLMSDNKKYFITDAFEWVSEGELEKQWFDILCRFPPIRLAEHLAKNNYDPKDVLEYLIKEGLL